MLPLMQLPASSSRHTAGTAGLSKLFCDKIKEDNLLQTQKECQLHNRGVPDSVQAQPRAIMA